MTPSVQMFVLALAALVAGTVLTVYVPANQAGMLLLGAAVGWLTSGGMARRKPPAPPAALLLVFALAASCTPGMAYVAADQGIFDTITPEYLGYVAADENLTDDQKARRARTVAAWKVLLDKSGGDK